MDHFVAALSEEQERKLSPEIEREREVQRAAPEKPALHALHPDMVTYVATGRLAADSSARVPAFASLSATSAARPYEAQMLLPAIQKSTSVALCLYAPRPNPGYSALDALDLYTVPEQLDVCVPPQFAICLNVFAGQLYFGSELEAIRVCHYLGINLSMAITLPMMICGRQAMPKTVVFDRTGGDTPKTDEPKTDEPQPNTAEGRRMRRRKLFDNQQRDDELAASTIVATWNKHQYIGATYPTLRRILFRQGRWQAATAAVASNEQNPAAPLPRAEMDKKNALYQRRSPGCRMMIN
ncbi:hypothetical protein ISF_09705 [Cordyceps fumosorosea ARSEF 2679]|uniref:Uncharacterized protein n=1 Tax=Cordyceps fumosorosea (strain ARSEF 2679) TaxID=1081104 RepID=A0A167DS43_CORFA|nr:hypothetical protein ISF_09705 [Cordyceps fumosorosea ARSEF 2679]OAA42789.1 hypothetical protein ISF_09705 [Cordyceps fumosorosea ARSEF 2679]